MRTLAVLFALALAATLVGQQKPVIKHTPAVATDPSSGPEMFQAYCAACHGKDAKGGGPAAPALNKPPGDLTQLTRKAGGRFPELQVYNVIRGDVGMPAHGSTDMPIWGRVFREMSPNTQMQHHRIGVLTKYLASIQK